jgi:hypothetical protein
MLPSSTLVNFKDQEAALNKDLQVFLGDVTKSFENVKAHLGEMTTELNSLKMAQSRRSSSAGPATGGA